MEGRGRAFAAASARAGSPGRRSEAGAEAAVGVDLGGTKIALGIVDPAGTLVAEERLPTLAARPAAAVEQDIVACVSERWANRLPASAALGVGVAGQVARDGTVRFGPNLGWKDVTLGADLMRALRRPVVVLNDVQAATYGEWKYGAGRGSSDLVCVFVGTGVGGGLVADGQLRHGARGTAGEVGHLTVASGGRPCRCGNRGCLEAYVGGWAIAERAQAAVAADPVRGRPLAAAAAGASRITSETVERAFREGDPLARELVAETWSYLASGLVSVVNALGPAVIVLGGGVIEGYPGVIASLEAEVRARALPAAVEGLRFAPAALGGASGVIGAAAYARATVAAGGTP